MHNSWKPLASEVRDSWQHAWEEKKRGAFASGQGMPQAPFRATLNDLTGMVRDLCKELDDEVDKWLDQLSDLEALSNEKETAEMLTGKVRDCAWNAVEEMRQAWLTRGLDASRQLHLIAEVTRTSIEDRTRAAAEKIAERIRLRKLAVEKDTDKDTKADFRDRVRTYTPPGVAFLGGLFTILGWFGGNWITSAGGVIVAAIASAAIFLHHKSTD